MCASEGVKERATLGHVDLLLVLSRHRLWEGGFEVAGKNSSQRRL